MPVTHKSFCINLSLKPFQSHRLPLTWTALPSKLREEWLNESEMVKYTARSWDPYKTPSFSYECTLSKDKKAVWWPFITSLGLYKKVRKIYQSSGWQDVTDRSCHWRKVLFLGDIWKFSHPYQVALDPALGKKHTYRKNNFAFYHSVFGSVEKET